MAVSFVGAGTYVAGNNASVTPGLPSGLLSGDLLLLLTYIRNGSATINTPSGWTSHIGGTATANDYSRIFYRTYTTGVTAPTVTFTGGGSNNTTQAQILAFRGAKTTGALNVGYGPLATSVVGGGGQFRDYAELTPYSIGDVLLSFTVWSNDTAPTSTAYATKYNPGATALALDAAGRNNTTLGADATLAYALVISPLNYSAGASYVEVATDYDGGTTGQGIRLIIYAQVSYPYTGVGGSKFGGAATATYRKTILSVSGAGGSKFGGVSTSQIRYPHYPVTGAGGSIFGGSAGQQMRSSVMPYAGAGGAIGGGAAQTTLVSPTTYHIDWFTGDDTRDGLSWATCFKTFHPLGDLQIPLLPGDVVKIAKTPDPVNRGVNVSAFQVTTGIGASGNILVNNALLTANQYILATMPTTTAETGWGYGPGGSAAGNLTTDGVLHCYSAYAVPDTLFLYRTLPSAIDLSSFSRLEIPFYYSCIGGISSILTLEFSLCSDTAGATRLLTVTMDPRSAAGGMAVYEGALPSGVNSIAFRYSSAVSTDVTFTLKSIIATRSLTDANYIGHLTEFRYGSHDGAVWMTPNNYLRNTSGVQVSLCTDATGDASISSSQPINTRTAVSWGRNPIFGSGGADTFSSVDGGGARTYYRPSTPGEMPLKPILNLMDIQGTPTSPIRILGGYDTSTNAVTGKTALLSFAQSCTDYRGAPAIGLGNTSDIYISDVDILDYSPISFTAAEGNSSRITFNNCELDVRYAQNTQDPDNPLKKSGAGAPLVPLVGFKFIGCKGSLYLNTGSTATVYMKDSAYTRYIRKTLAGGYIEAEGTVKFYGAFTDNILPIITKTYGATLQVYAMSSATLYPYAEPGVLNGTWVYPIFWCQNACISFGGNSSLSYQEAPEITMVLTPSIMGLTSLGVNYLVKIIDNNTPLHVKKLTVSGSRPSGLSDTSMCVVFTNKYAPIVQVSNVDATGLSGYKYILASSGTAGNSGGLGNSGVDTGNRGVYSSRMTIINGFSSSPTGYIYDTYLLGGTSANYIPVQGIVDIRNATITNISGSYNLFTTPRAQAGGRIRYVNCTISNSMAVPPMKMPDVFDSYPAHSGSQTFDYESTGFDVGSVYEDCSITPQTSFGVASPGSTEFSFTRSQAIFDMRRSIAISQSSPKSHTVFCNSAFTLEKDYAINGGSEYSWKTFLYVGLVSPLSFNLPLATIPIPSGKLITISLNTYRSNASAFCGLVVFPNGCSGYATPQDFQEYIALNTAANNIWQRVQVQFVSQRAGWIDIYWSHFGADQLSARFTDLRVDQT